MPINFGSTNIGAIYKGTTKITKVYKGSDIVFQSGLPNDYIQLEYIESTGTQYIDSGVNVSSNIKAYLENTYDGFSNTGTYTRNGGRTATTQNEMLFISLNASVFRVDMGTTDLDHDNQKTFTYQKSAKSVELDAPNRKSKIIYIDDSTEEATYTFDNFSTSIPFVLFAYNTGGTITVSVSQKLTNAKFWNNGTLIRDFIPAYRRTDGVVGLYDMVNGVFYTNAGTGEFKRGAMILKNYYELEYIESDGNQWIDTGVVPTNTTGFMLDYQLTQTPSDNFTYGVRSSQNGRFIAGGKSDGLYLGYGADVYSALAGPSVMLNRQQAYLNYKNNGKAKIVNEVSIAVSLPTFTSEYTIYVFARKSYSGTSVVGFPQKVYRNTITEGSNIIRDFIPIMRATDNAVGLYDAKNNIFYANAGTGTFTKGENV